MAESRRPRNLIPLLTLAGVLAIAVVVVLVFLLNRMPTPVAASAPGAPAPEASSDPVAPSPTPSETLEPAASEVVMGADGFTIVADDGSELYAYRWRDDAVSAVTALADAFGAEPAESIYEGDGTHYPDYTSYAWDGFTLRDMIETEGSVPRSQYSMPSFAVLEANEVSGVALTPEFGLSIGQTAEEVSALGPDREAERSDGSWFFAFLADEDGEDVEDDPGTDDYSLWVSTDPGDETVTSITYRLHSEL